MRRAIAWLSLLISGVSLAVLTTTPAIARTTETSAARSFLLACPGQPERVLTVVSGVEEWACPSRGGMRSGTGYITIDTQVFDLPPDGTVVTSSATVEESGEIIDEISVARAGYEIAVQISEEAAIGAPAAIAVVNANLPDTAENSDRTALQPYADYSVKCAQVGQETAYQGRWEDREYSWRYNPKGEPGVASTTALVSAQDSVALGESTLCGDWSNRSEITFTGEVYSEEPQILADGGCGTFSRTNTVGWGPLNNESTLAVACTWRQGGFIVKSDIKFDISSRSWNTANSCSGSRYDVQGIATHEFGHAMGLGHVFQESQQVMKPESSTCELDQRELGYGDQENLVTSYG